MEKTTSQSPIPNLTFSTGTSIPQVGLGTYQMRNEECTNAVKIAIKYGYRHIDTASIYRNGEAIAKALDELYRDKVITREELFITSKIAPSEQGYENALAACDDIMKKLNTSYLDLLIIHWPGVSKYKPEAPEVAGIRLETWRALEKLKADGKVRDIGVSNFLVRHLEHLAKNSATKPVINQFELHPLCYNKELVEYCKKNGIVVEAYSSLAQNADELMKNKTMLECAKKYNKTTQQIALKWGLQNGFVVLPKSRNEKYIKSNLELFDFEMSEEDMAKLNAMDRNFHTCWDPASVTY